MSLLHEAWVALRHSGNLLSPLALDGLPSPSKPKWGLADRLRSALVTLDPNQPKSSALGDLLDTILEEVCGFEEGWEKANSLSASDAEKLLDGTVLKPRRRWTGSDGETLVVFTSTATRLGLGKGRRPVAQVVEYLRRRAIPLGLLTNGTQWRLIWADADSLAWAEWEADRWLDADRLAGEFEVLRCILAPATLLRAGADLSPLLAAIRDTRRGQAKLSKELGERVRCAVETLLRSRAPLLGPAWDEHESNALYVAACHFVMRLVVTLFAEARELLPVDNPIYHHGYGLRGLLDQLDRLTPERRRARTMAWPRLLALYRLLHQGSLHPAIILPAYGGDLFRPGDVNGDGVQRALALLEALPEPPDDDVVHHLLVLLTRTKQRVREGSAWRSVAAPVDFTELTSEYIGILYEGLLDYELHRAGEQPVVFLNLGDQPALPLDRLEGMDDKALKALVEKAKVKKQAASEGDDEGEGDASEDDPSDEVDIEEDADSSEPSETDAALVEEEESQDDARAEARARALAWGRRAAEVAKLVKKPKGKKVDLAVYEAQLDTAAKQLVADLKLPGELYLVRWGGTRKGAGTFYTRPQLTLPTVRRTLEPLLYDGGDARTVRPPEVLLALKVCDPAMGSGSFLVAALRVLTAAVVESLHVHKRITQVNGNTTVDCELWPEGDRSLPTEGFEERLAAIVRRAVVEHCLYGVDLDPLAVELARVALWVETLDKRLPFTFLDHKLRCGNSLIGTWLDRFRDYPLLAFDRQSPDEKYKGVHHVSGVWQESLKDRRAKAISEQVDLLTTQRRMHRPNATDEELKAAVDRVRRLYRELRAVPAGRPDERARIWRARIQTDAALGRVREAFDTWCALWFWPLDQLDVLPLPSELPVPSEAARAVVKAVREKKRFLHWELEFPDVFTEEGAGFDAVVGNPPWEIQKPNSKEFFSNYDPLYRAYGKQEALQVQNKLFDVHPLVETEWLAYNGDFKDRANFVKHVAEPFGDGKVTGHGGGDVSMVRGKLGVELHKTWRGKRARYRGNSDPAHPFRHQGSADLNTYKMFVEVAHALLRSGGEVGLVVPSGLYSDKGTGELRTILLERCVWRWLYGFENRNKLLDIDSRFKFCVTIATKGGRTQALQSAFMRHTLEDWGEAKGALPYSAEQVTAFSPSSLSILEIRLARDLAILTKIYANGVVLGNEGPEGWGIKYAREFDMTNDSNLFIRRQKAESEGFAPDVYGRWVDNCGEVLLPLYQGLMFYDLSSNRVAYLDGAGHNARWETVVEPSNPVRPQFFMTPLAYGTEGKATATTKIGFRALSNATNERTFVACLLENVPCGNSVGVLTLGDQSLVVHATATASFASLAYDWTMRLRIGGTNVNAFFVLESGIPQHVPPRAALIVLSLTMTGNRHAPRWLEARQSGLVTIQNKYQRLWAITPHERLRLRCMLDAIVAALYGLDRDDFSWILKDCDHPASLLADRTFCRQLDPKGFWRVDKTQDPELPHTVLSLVAFDDLQRAINAAGGERDAGIRAFCDQHDGDGWMLPESLCLADLGMTRTVNDGDYDSRALTQQPVRSRMGERFLDWQLAQTPEESWAECERHAKAIVGGIPPSLPPSSETNYKQPSLFDRIGSSKTQK